MDVGLRQEGLLRHTLWKSTIRVHLADPSDSLDFRPLPVVAG